MNETMKEINYKQIGIIHSPLKEPRGTPIQAAAAKGIEGSVEVFQEYTDGLEDLDGFSHIILIYHFHLCNESSLKIKPYMDYQKHGIFSTRAPCRPNPIGISVVRLVKINKNILQIKDLDIIDRTPLLDIKPYVPVFDVRSIEKSGWLKNNIHKVKKTKDDGRFME